MRSYIDMVCHGVHGHELWVSKNDDRIWMRSKVTCLGLFFQFFFQRSVVAMYLHEGIFFLKMSLPLIYTNRDESNLRERKLGNLNHQFAYLVMKVYVRPRPLFRTFKRHDFSIPVADELGAWVRIKILAIKNYVL